MLLHNISTWKNLLQVILSPKKPPFFCSKYPLTGKYHYEYVKLCVVKLCWVNYKAFVCFPLCSLEVKMIWSIPGETMKKNLAALRTRSAQLMHDGWPAEEVIRRATCQRNTHSTKTYACPLKELTLISRTKEVHFFPSCSTHNKFIFKPLGCMILCRMPPQPSFL